MSNPFDYVNSVLVTKKNLIVDAATEKAYQPFLTNRSLSYNVDTILYAQEMNVNSHLDKKLQYDYYINIIRPYKRKFTKWSKLQESGDIDNVKEYYGYSYQKAKVAVSILSRDQLDEIKRKLEKGG